MGMQAVLCQDCVCTRLKMYKSRDSFVVFESCSALRESLCSVVPNVQTGTRKLCITKRACSPCKGHLNDSYIYIRFGNHYILRWLAEVDCTSSLLAISAICGLSMTTQAVIAAVWPWPVPTMCGAIIMIYLCTPCSRLQRLSMFH